MTSQPTDRDLVAALLGGNRAALGHIYDRYSDALYDTAAAMLRDRDEAGDAVQEVFLVAATKLEQIRDPDRLKPWLFAVLRHEVFRRTKRRRRNVPVDLAAPGLGGVPEMVAPTDPRAEAAGVERRELAALVRAAAAGLDERDQLVMELTLRQELSGADLAAAVGVTTAQGYVLVNRMRERLSKSLGAVTVARMGRDDCDELAALLADWDGTFSVLIRKRVARHIERCAVCDDTRAKYPVGALYSAAPVLAAPAVLRDTVLDAALGGSPPHAVPRFDDDGFPRGARSARVLGVRRRPWMVAASVLAVVGIGAGVASTLESSPDDVTAIVDQSTASSTAATVPGSTVPTSEPTGSSSPTASSSPIAPSPPSSAGASSGGGSSPGAGSSEEPAPPSATPGSVVVSTASIDLGDAAPSASVVVSNPGDETVDWSITRDGSSPYVWSAVAGSLAPGASSTLTVSVDRSALDEGDYVGAFIVAGGTSSSPVQVLAAVERPPEITIVGSSESVSCGGSAFVLASVTDESSVQSVVLRWSGPGGNGESPMIEQSAGWEGTAGPANANGDWTYTIVATDTRGNSASLSRPFVVTGCGGGSGGGFATP